MDERDELSHRLDKLESSDTKLNESMNKLIIEVTKLTVIMGKITEDQADLSPRLRNLEENSVKYNRLENLEDRVAEIEKSSINSEVTLKAIKILAGIVATSVIGIVVTIFFQRLSMG